jgi:protocatechuate 3,4-dioxygenase beta subunit
VACGEPLGQRIVVSGRVLDSGGRPVPDTLIEIWQTNAADRYQHKQDQTPGADREIANLLSVSRLR